MNYFITLTPYHIILTLIFKKHKNEDLIILIDEYGNLKKFYKIVSKLNIRIKYFNVSYKSKIDKVKKTHLTWNASLKKNILGTINKDKPCRTYIFNDNNPISQYIIHNINSETIYIEDGAAPYNDHFINNSILKKIIYKLLYGTYYEFTNILGTTKKISYSILTYPEYARKENKIKQIIQFDCKKNYRNILKKLYTLFDNSNPSKSAKTLLLLPHTSSEYFPIYNNIIHKINKNEFEDQTFVKYHPLDIHIQKFERIKNVTVIDQYISSEILLGGDIGINKIISPPSTSLISSKFLFPEIDSYCLINYKKNNNPFTQMLSNIGVKFIYEHDL